MQWPWISRKRHERELELLKHSLEIRSRVFSNLLAANTELKKQAADVWGGRAEIPKRRS